MILLWCLSHKTKIMSFLRSHHIVNIYCWVDDLVVKKSSSVGRPSILSDSELITILVWNTLVLRQKTLKDVHRIALCHLSYEFPHFPTYNAFLEHCHRVTPLMYYVLQTLLDGHSPLVFMDSTMLPVCKLKRSDTHKVAKSIAQYGKNHQGWHYGFKLHVAVSSKKYLSAIALTPANRHDAQVMPYLVNKHTRVGVGDSHYGAKVMGRKLWKKYGTVFITPPHFTQKRKVATPLQNILFSQRSKIEAVFDILKEHLHLVSSFPRSIHGYLVHYVRVLLGYQVMALLQGE